MADSAELPPVVTPSEAASVVPAVPVIAEAAPSVTPDPVPAVTEPAKDSGEPVVADAPVPEPQDAPQSAEPAPLPTYEPFVLPEGFQADETLTQFTNDMAEFERAHGVDHEAMRAFGQQMVDKYAAKNQETLRPSPQLDVDCL